MTTEKDDRETAGEDKNENATMVARSVPEREVRTSGQEARVVSITEDVK